MNLDLYLFGDFGNGYTQYIDDNTNVKFKSFVEKARAKSQLVVHRDDALIYYTYIRRLHNQESSSMRYIGISYVLNTYFVQDIGGLFSLFEGAITTIASRGILLKYLPSGYITPNIEKIYQAKSEFAHVSAYLKSELDSFMVDKKVKLPTLDYSINTSEFKAFTFTDSLDEIVKSISIFPTVYIYKDKNYENEESQSYSTTLSKLNKEKLAAQKTLKEKELEINKLEKEKKNYKLVSWLFLVIAIGSIIFFTTIRSRNKDIVRLKDDVYNKELIITNQTSEISLLNDSVASKDGRISELRMHYKQLDRQNKDLDKANTKLEKEKKELLKEKQDLSAKFKMTEKTLKDANAKISQKDSEIAQLKKQSNNSSQGNKNVTYYKTRSKAECYYIDKNHNYKKTGYSFGKGFNVAVYGKNSKYALTDRGYILLSDLQ